MFKIINLSNIKQDMYIIKQKMILYSKYIFRIMHIHGEEILFNFTENL